MDEQHFWWIHIVVIDIAIIRCGSIHPSPGTTQEKGLSKEQIWKADKVNTSSALLWAENRIIHPLMEWVGGVKECFSFVKNVFAKALHATRRGWWRGTRIDFRVRDVLSDCYNWLMACSAIRSLHDQTMVSPLLTTQLLHCSSSIAFQELVERLRACKLGVILFQGRLKVFNSILFEVALEFEIKDINKTKKLHLIKKLICENEFHCGLLNKII